ncbi:MAG TPA: hypothetical protein VKZ95_03220 [Sphingobacteriaceae bacterium]|nr:hypothetical protein [Sphingobacteriaceae bacterium]
MKKRRGIKLLIAALLILVGGIVIRIAWVILSTFFIVLGAGVFIGGIIYLTNTVYKSKNNN